MTFKRVSIVALALAAALAFIAEAADARVGGGNSSGSRGSRTFNSAPPTATAPKPSAPIERSMTQPGAPATAAQGAARPGTAGAPASRFGGFGGLLMGGLLGAGLFGLLSGSGLFGGLSGFASVLGLLLQVALIGGVAYLVISYFRNRNQPAMARASTGGPGIRLAARHAGLGSRCWNAGFGVPSSGPLAIGQADFDAFEKLLGDIQVAYGREDVDALGAMTTPEMLSYFSQDLAENARKGVRDEVAGVKLLQGDLSEAWREGGSDYATVAMRFALLDATVDRATGKVVSGSRTEPQEVTEVWTFRRDDRDRAQGWQLSAIQQV